ncbi:MAG: RHS repeat protein, partial [bacterium]|nr:RHS repeat protein [bacterium]
MVDPDKGSWTYRYNALGLLVDQTNANGQLTTIDYDVLGRMVARTDNAAGTNPETATWVYDSAATKGIGKLASSANANLDYQKVITYDGLGRPSSTTETIDGTAYPITTTYDGFSRPEDLIYPSGLTVRNVYGTYGHLSEVTKPDGTPYWQALEQDAYGNISKFRLGNGVESRRTHDYKTGRLEAAYAEHDDGSGVTTLQDLTFVFDVAGNLIQRTDAGQGLIEDFTYDTLNRVTSVVTVTGADPSDSSWAQPASLWSGGSTTTVDVFYDALGNIVSKTGIGAYIYGEDHGCGAGAAGPHA